MKWKKITLKQVHQTYKNELYQTMICRCTIIYTFYHNSTGYIFSLHFSVSSYSYLLILPLSCVRVCRSLNITGPWSSVIWASFGQISRHIILYYYIQYHHTLYFLRTHWRVFILFFYKQKLCCFASCSFLSLNSINTLYPPSSKSQTGT